MSIYFRNTPAKEPFIFDTVGNHWKQDREIRPNGYPLYHYLQTEKGKGKITIQGKEYMLNEGEGVLLAPYTSHSYAAESDNWITLFATITGSVESSIANMLGNRHIIFTDKEQGERIAQLVSDVMEKYDNPPVNAKELSIDCYCFLMNFVDGVYRDEMMDDPLYKRYVGPVVQEIETNFSTKITAAQLSKKVFVSPQYLSRLFVRFLGCSVYEYLTTYRITKAKEILFNNPKIEIQTVAGMVGFDDASHFIAMFKKMTGVTPVEFRTLYKYQEL